MNMENFTTEPLKVVEVKEFQNLLLPEELFIYSNKILPSTINDSSIDDLRLRYFQQTMCWHVGDEEEEKRERLSAENKMLKMFSMCCDKRIIQGVMGTASELDLWPLNEYGSRRLIYLWIVLKDEYIHLTKEELNEMIKHEF